MSEQGCEQLMLFQEDFHASLSALPGSEKARKMTVTSGRKCCELYRKSGPLGLLVKMCLESSIWRSTRCYLTWKASATPAKHLLFQLAASMPRTADIELRLWATPRANDAEKRGMISADKRNGLPAEVLLWPTPSASDCGRTAINPHTTKNGTIRHIGKTGKQSYARLDAVAALFPTPKARDARDTTRLPPSRIADRNKDSLVQRVGREIKEECGQLNPTWVEWLMGFPIGWTDLDASEMP